MLTRKLLAIASLMLAGTLAFAQGQLTVSGTVTDGQTGETVPGAAVILDGTSAAAVTDARGYYSLTVPSDGTLRCACLGYAEQKQSVSGRTTVDFVLQVDTEMIEETVVIGYGTLKKTQLVGSVESVSGEVLEDRPNADITRSLQGQVPGLNIVQTDGKPTHGGNVYIRGGATSYISREKGGSGKASYSIGQGGFALVLIDGVEGELSSVNPEDVESISVLKDASSSVIYGARAAYGVVLVTTKTGSRDRISVSYNGSVSINSRTVKWEDNIIDSGLGFLENYYEFMEGYTATPQVAGTLPTKINTYAIPTDYLQRYRQHVANGDTNTYEIYNKKYLYYTDNNYIAMMYKPSNATTTHNLSVNGSSGKVSYGISARYYTQEGIYKVGEENYNAFNLRAKLKIQATNWLSVDNNTALYRMGYTQPMFSKADGNVGSQLRQIAMQGQPMIPVTNEDGTWTVGAAAGGYAAFASGNSGQREDKFTVTSTTGATIDFIKDVLKLRGEFAYKNNVRKLNRYTAPIDYSVTPGATTAYIKQTDTYVKKYDYSTEQITANVFMTWTPKLGDNHQLNVVGGWNLENYNYTVYGVTRTGILYPGKTSMELMDGQETITIDDYLRSYGLVGFFARANYTLFSRYIIELSARYDGSSKFPKNQQWGFFPSASIGWRISEEPWMKGAKGWLDNLKLRANAGSLGNGNVTPYAFLNLMGVSKTSAVFNGTFANKVSDPSVVPDNLTWERVTTYDAGLDLDVLHSRLSFSGDYYIRNTTDLYVTGPEIPAVFGDSTPKGNYGALKTRGWELTLAWKDGFKLGGKDFNYTIKGSLWDSRTWVTRYNSTTGSIFSLYEGKELGELWGFRTDGLYLTEEAAVNSLKDNFHVLLPKTPTPHAGDIIFRNLNGDDYIDAGALTLQDHGDLTIIGNEAPRYQWGINLDFNWNGIGLSAFLQGVGKRDWYPAQGTDFFWGSYARAYGFALKSQALDHVILDKTTENWTVTNPDAYWPRPSQSTAEDSKGSLCFPNDRYLQNAAYLRLKNLTLDYSLPKKVTDKMKIQKLRFYVSGENLLTFSPLFKHTQMFDPEVIFNGDSDFNSGTSTTMGDGYSYPMLRTVTFGINLTL